MSIDSNGNILTSSDGRFIDPIAAANPIGGDPYYDAVPVGTPTLTETDPGGNVVDPTVLAEVGDTLHANVVSITDADGISTPVSLQWQVQDFLSGVWLPIVGATGADFKITSFQDGNALRVKASYVDGKGVTETVVSGADHPGHSAGWREYPAVRGRAAAAHRHSGHHGTGRPSRSTTSCR